MEHNAKKIAGLLRVLGNEHPLMILCVLIKSPRTVGEIAERIGHISQSALSQHLALMKAHHVLSSQKSGQSVTYSIADGRVKEIMDVLKAHYCTGGD